MKKNTRTENVAEIIHRILVLKGLKNEKGVAELLGISPTDFSNRKKRGTLTPLIVNWAVHENVDTRWLLKGDGEMEAKPPARSASVTPLYNKVEIPTSVKVAEVADPVSEIIEGLAQLARKAPTPAIRQKMMELIADLAKHGDKTPEYEEPMIPEKKIA